MNEVTTMIGWFDRQGIFALACILLAAAALGHALRAQEDATIKSRLASEALAISSLIEQRLELQATALQRLADRWAYVGGTPRDAWEDDVRRYTLDFPEVQAVEWVDPGYFVRWIVPYAGNQAAQDLDLGFERNRRTAIEAARKRHAVLVTAPIDLVQGGKGFLMLFPIFPRAEVRPSGLPPDGFGGFILGVFRTTELIAPLVQRAGVDVAVYGDDTIIYGAPRIQDSDSWRTQATFERHGRRWSVELSPTADYLAEARSAMPWGLAAGAALLSAIVFSLLRVARALRTSNRIAEQERERAEKAARIKSQFVATMSHEIRTPLNGVVVTTELLEATPLARDQQELVEMLQSSSRSLLAVVNDVLDFSKLEANKVEVQCEPTRAAEIVDNVARVLTSQAEEKGILISIEGTDRLPAWLLIDADRVHQILLNLVGNAVKFTERGRVTVACRYDPEASLLGFEVRDTGIGIRDPRGLFDAFTQEDSGTTRRFGGTGLGLSITKRLCESMGGQIEVETVRHEGSTFRVTIPAALSDLPRETTHAGKARSQASNGGRALVVDDNHVNRLVAQRCLERLGYQVDLASEGNEAVSAAQRTPYSVIFMDCQMPGMDGYQATGAIRERETGQRVPIIAMTANARSEDRERCLAAGMDAFLSKPFSLERIRAALEVSSHATRGGDRARSISS